MSNMFQLTKDEEFHPPSMACMVSGHRLVVCHTPVRPTVCRVKTPFPPSVDHWQRRLAV